MRAVRTSMPADASDVEISIYYYGQLKVHHWCRPDEARRITNMWSDVIGMRCEVSYSPVPATPDAKATARTGRPRRTTTRRTPARRRPRSG